jgi:hypothetical protein
MPGFFLRRGSEVTGPHEAAALRAMAARGELHGEHEVSRDGRAWRRLRDVRGFSALAPAGEPVEAPGPPAPDADPITLAEVAAPVWAALRRAGKVAAKAAGRAASAGGDAASSAARSVRRASDALAKARSMRGTYTFMSFHDVRLSRKLETPMGSRVTVVHLWLTARYAIVGDGVMIQDVRLARPSETPEGLNMAAARTGEAFAFTDYRSLGSLDSLVRLEVADGLHRRIMEHHRRVAGCRTRD